MCGIAGIAGKQLSEEAARARVAPMTNRLRERGPDGEGVWAGPGVALGHRRLSIIDLDGGRQPMQSACGRWTIVFNGEIYNFPELKSELQAKGHSFRTQSDTEVILELFRAEGPAGVRRLNGIFAFAIFDGTARSLFLARDPFGVKPLFYTHSPGGDLLFASEVKGILPGLPAKPSIDPVGLERFLHFEHLPAPDSIYAGIRKLEAGTTLLWQNGEVRMERFYTMPFGPARAFDSEEVAVVELERRLRQAVGRQMLSDVPVGVFLSGGIDSSLVTRYMSELSPGLPSFSVGFAEESFDETPFAEEVSKQFGTRHQVFSFGENEMREMMPATLRAMDEPFADPSFFPSTFLCRRAKEHVKVVLGGDAGDELFGGYPTYYARTWADRMPALPLRWAGKVAQLLPASERNLSWDFVAKKFLSGFEETNADLRHQIWLGGLTPSQVRAVLRERGGGGLSPILEHMRSVPGLRGWERSQWIDLRFYLQDGMLVKMDRAGMLHGLEVRVPFLDPDLADFALHLPANLKYRGRVSKYLLRTLAARALPPTISARKKKGFGIPLARWMRQSLREDCDRVFLGGEHSGFFHRETVARYYRQHREGRADFRKLLWPIFIFEEWYRLQKESDFS